MYLFMAALGLQCCMQAFSRCGELGLLSSCSERRLTAVVSVTAERWL